MKITQTKHGLTQGEIIIKTNTSHVLRTTLVLVFTINKLFFFAYLLKVAISIVILKKCEDLQNDLHKQIN